MGTMNSTTTLLLHLTVSLVYYRAVLRFSIFWYFTIFIQNTLERIGLHEISFLVILGVDRRENLLNDAYRTGLNPELFNGTR